MKTDIRNNVGLRIKELRRKGGITQEKFALMTGINRSYLADIEQGNRKDVYKRQAHGGRGGQ